MTAKIAFVVSSRCGSHVDPNVCIQEGVSQLIERFLIAFGAILVTPDFLQPLREQKFCLLLVGVCGLPASRPVLVAVVEHPLAASFS